ncbi:MAG: universal stress protein [Nitrospirota bacterium]
MYKRILAAVNEHINSEVSARYAMQLARATGARMYVCYVAEKEAPEKSLETAEDAVKRLFNSSKDLGIDTESVVETGRPLEKIREFAASEKIDIAFIATRREDVYRRFYAGTVARRLLVSLPCSVALVRVVHMGRISPRNILVPLKARVDHINERSYFTAMLANSFRAGVNLFHTTKPITKFFHGEIDLTPLEWNSRLPHDLLRFVDRLEEYGIVHEKRLMPGRAGREIAIEAASKRSDLIILGASERSLLNTLLRGNPVEDLMRRTPCNLIILKPRHEHK